MSQTSSGALEGPAVPAESPTANPATVPAPASPSGSPSPSASPSPKAVGEFNVLCYTLLALFAITFSVWAIYAWIDYGTRYAPLADGWYAGGTRTVEITLVREDVNNLDCASDATLGDLHCAYRANQQPFDPAPDTVRLRPYNTADNVLFLAAGLWSSPGLAGQLPAERFTVTCNYRMVSTIKSIALRWSQSGTFAGVKNAVPAGLLSDCVIPR